MTQPMIYEGILEELLADHSELARKRVRLTILDSAETAPKPMRTGLIRFGMFPQLQTLTEEDFQSAEWRGEELDA